MNPKSNHTKVRDLDQYSRELVEMASGQKLEELALADILDFLDGLADFHKPGDNIDSR